MKKNLWTEEMLRTLAELYPMETNAFTASVLQVGETAVKEKARELGLVKVVKSKWLNRAEHIRSHFEERSFTEIARELGITRHSVSRIAGKLGLKRSKPESYQVSSRVRMEMIRRERRRVIFGLDLMWNYTSCLRFASNCKRHEPLRQYFPIANLPTWINPRE